MIYWQQIKWSRPDKCPSQTKKKRVAALSTWVQQQGTDGDRHTGFHGGIKEGMLLPTRGKVRARLPGHGQDKAVERRAGCLQAEDTPCRRLEGKRWEAERRAVLYGEEGGHQSYP